MDTNAGQNVTVSPRATKSIIVIGFIIVILAILLQSYIFLCGRPNRPGILNGVLGASIQRTPNQFCDGASRLF